MTAAEEKQTPSTPPKGWIRWSGLVTFAALVAAVVAISYLSVTLLLKNQLEHYASQAWGAKVEIGDIDLGIFPIRVGVSNLRVTDPDKPMENLFQVGHIGASLNFYHWVVGRTVIDNLRLEKLAFNQPRKTSGALKKVKKTAAEQAAEAKKKPGMKLEMPSFVVPKPEEVLARQNLKTPEKAEAIKQQLSELDQQWSSLQKQLPSQQMINDFQQRFNQITQGDFKNPAEIQAKQKEFEALQKEVSQKMAVVEKSRDLFQSKLPKLQKDVAELKRLPAQDLKNLQQAYSFDQKGVSNLTYMLYGPKVQHYVDQANYWYQKAKPFIDKISAKLAASKAEKQQQQAKRLAGQNIAFKEYDPEPSFIIKHLSLSTQIDWGKLTLNARNVNFTQASSHMPITYQAEVQPASQPSALKVTGESNWVQPGKGFNLAKIEWPNYQIKDWALAKDDNLPIWMNQAKADVAGVIRLGQNADITGDMKLAYHDVDFDLSRTKSKDVKRYLAPIFSEIRQFTVNSDISGSLMAPSIGAKSDLDRHLSSAFNKVIEKEVAKAKADLTKQFNAMVAQQLGPVNQQLAGLLGDQNQLNKGYNGLDKILSGNSDAFAKEAQEKLQKQMEDKAKSEVKNKLEDALKQFKF
ncbi:MAG: TIGR03545 family protein [Hydrogenovibrio sp.]|nr:TIGR03545 family protein [Hydrogenovibrio sp.]